MSNPNKLKWKDSNLIHQIKTGFKYRLCLMLSQIFNKRHSENAYTSTSMTMTLERKNTDMLMSFSLNIKITNAKPTSMVDASLEWQYLCLVFYETLIKCIGPITSNTSTKFHQNREPNEMDVLLKWHYMCPKTH